MGCPISSHMVFTSPPSLFELTERMSELSGLRVVALNKTASESDMWNAELAFELFPLPTLQVTCRDSEHSTQVGSSLPPDLDIETPWTKVAQEEQYDVQVRIHASDFKLYSIALCALEDLGGQYFEPLTCELRPLTSAERANCSMPVSDDELRSKYLTRLKQDARTQRLAPFMQPLLFLFIIVQIALGIPLLLLGMAWKKLRHWLNPQYEQIQREKWYAVLLRRNPEAKVALLRQAEQKSRNLKALAQFKEMIERAALCVENER